MNWYYADGAGKQAGPVDDATLDALAAGGGINAETLVWREGMSNWQPLREARAAGGLRVAAGGGGEAVCAECGQLFPLDDTIKVGNARVCANCKPVFVQKMREGVNLQQPGALNYAGFWIRFGAYFLDGIILYVVNAFIKVACGFGVASFLIRVPPGESFGPLLIGLFFLQMVIAMSYETFMVGKYGATLGKMACKLRVVTPEGSRVSYARALGRYFSKIVSSIICFIGFIMAGFDPEKRALHDRMCSTRVVYK
jgi:uncharacterized RDD family membrane protein YckC